LRAIVVIYIAAGLTLLFAVMGTLADAGHAYMAHHAIATLTPAGDELERMRGVRRHDLESAAESFSLALLQGGIIVSARKLGKQTTTNGK
jgi:hypothetical protein